MNPPLRTQISRTYRDCEDKIAHLVEVELYNLQIKNKIVCENGIFVKKNVKKQKVDNNNFGC